MTNATELLALPYPDVIVIPLPLEIREDCVWRNPLERRICCRAWCIDRA